MKNFNRRNKIVLAIAGVVIVVLIAGIAILGVGDTGLFGGSVITIQPSGFSVHVGTTYKASVNALFGCNWSSSDATIATFVGDHTKVKSVTVIGVAVGTVTIKANCTAANPTATVVVYPALPTPTFTPAPTNTPAPTRTPTPTPKPLPTATPSGMWLNPANATVSRNQALNYTVVNYQLSGGYCTNWASDKGSFSVASQNAATLMVEGYTGIQGTGYVRVVCNGVTVQTSITVQ